SSGLFQINWWLIIYFSGLLFSLGLFLKKYFGLKKMFRFKVVSEENGFKIIEVPNSNLACTFFNTIFLGEALKLKEKEHILSHEMVHVIQKHSWDLVFFELLKMVFWFNPLIYIFQQKIATLHEFIADAQAVKTTERKTYYHQLLNTAFNTQNISFTNQFFNHSLIKKRIVMLQKSQSKSVGRLKYLVLLPLLLVMLTYVSCSEENFSENASPAQLSESGEVLTLKVKDAKNLTEAEKAKRSEIIDLLGTKGNASALVITDGESVSRIRVSPFSGPQVPSSSKSSEKTQMEKPDGVPFAIIEQVPVFPGCEGLSTKEAKKKCMQTKIREFVDANFKRDKFDASNLQGINRIYVQFKITSSGNIEVKGVRGPTPQLEAEARRVISELPKMIPGKQDGKPVDVLYALPIIFKVDE
ncbi:MAG TPA: M56 family metallopeptidase, partial [Salinimicrobium sp.]|nr:M56 family metallopeptidase [Salinimicrobium sp.]